MDQDNLIKERHWWQAVVNTGMKLTVQKNAGISWPVKDPVPAQDVLCFIDLVKYSVRYLHFTPQSTIEHTKVNSSSFTSLFLYFLTYSQHTWLHYRVVSLLSDFKLLVFPYRLRQQSQSTNANTHIHTSPCNFGVFTYCHLHSPSTGQWFYWMYKLHIPAFPAHVRRDKSYTVTCDWIRWSMPEEPAV